MAKIVKYPDPVLREKCREVKNVDEKLEKVVEDLSTTLMEKDNGIGLAAPQIAETLRVFAIKPPGHDHASAESDSAHVYINPQILDRFEKEKIYPQVYTEEGDRDDFYEGCLSIPGIYGTVKRWIEIRVRYQRLSTSKVSEDPTLEVIEETLEGLMAIVFQHELDHLNGVLFIDHIKEENGQVFKDSGDGLEKIDTEEILNKEK